MCEQTADADHALYLYCFARAGAPADFAGDDRLFAYRFGELIAVCGWTAMREWSGASIEERMQELDWLAPRAIRHQAVIEAAMRVSPVLPARLGTLFSSPQALDRFFAIHHVAIATFLADVESKEEWAVKGVLDRARASEWLASTINSASQGGAPGGGTDYLRQRRAHAAAARELNRWAAQIVEPMVAELRGHAARFCQRSPGAQAAAGQAQPIFNAAFLVAQENLAGFRRCVEGWAREHSEHGLELALSGPWPPYSFCPTLEMPP